MKDKPIYYAYFRGWIVTANPDGSIPLNAKCLVDLRGAEGLKVANAGSVSEQEIIKLVAQANLAADLSTPPMTKKDFVSIAEAIRDARLAASYVQGDPAQAAASMARIFDSMAKSIAPVLAQQNPKFKRKEFLAICGVVE